MKPRSSSHFLEWSYNSQLPLRTLWRWTDCSTGRAIWMILVFAVKQLPAWTTPVLVGFLIDEVRTNPETWTRYWPLIAVQFVLIIQNVPVHTYFITQLSKLTRRLENRIRRALVTRLQQLSIPYHDDSESGELQAKVLRDVEQIQVLAHQLGEWGITALTTAVAMLIITISKQPLVLLIYVLLIPIMTLLTRKFRDRMKKENQAFRRNIESMNSEVSQMIDMIPVSRAHGVEDKAVNKVKAKIRHVGQTGRRLDRINAIFQASNWSTFQMFSLIMLLVMLTICARGLISIGDVVVFQALFGQTFMLVNMVLNIYPQLAKGMESVRSIGEVLECPDLEYNQGKPDVPGVNGEIVYQDVGYTYRGAEAPAVQNVSLHVPAGQCLAVVGPSGGGKSTLLRLTIGFRRPTEGQILLDGLDMEEIDMRSWRRFISVVPQESVFFEGSIRENILFGTRTVDPDRFEEILDAANVREFIERLPEGLDSRIGESGARLSGGQRQRLAIARALVRDPQVIVLDEPTSALDVMSEKLVQEAIERLVKGRTTLIVAHRLSTIRNADKVVVMEQGQIVEAGTYDELSARPDSAFKRMKDLQS